VEDWSNGWGGTTTEVGDEDKDTPDNEDEDEDEDGRGTDDELMVDDCGVFVELTAVAEEGGVDTVTFDVLLELFIFVRRYCVANL
jgi:hypothetical protein